MVHLKRYSSLAKQTFPEIKSGSRQLEVSSRFKNTTDTNVDAVNAKKKTSKNTGRFEKVWARGALVCCAIIATGDCACAHSYDRSKKPSPIKLAPVENRRTLELSLWSRQFSTAFWTNLSPKVALYRWLRSEFGVPRDRWKGQRAGTNWRSQGEIRHLAKCKKW